MKKRQQKIILILCITTTLILLPLQLRAEAEPLYVSGLDLDYMESNQFLSWLEEMKYRLTESSPFFKDIFDSGEYFVETQNEES